MASNDSGLESVFMLGAVGYLVYAFAYTGKLGYKPQVVATGIKMTVDEVAAGRPGPPIDWSKILDPAFWTKTTL